MKSICLLFTCWALSSCMDSFKEEQLYGYYTAVGYINTTDTIQLKPDSIYQRRVYDKQHRLVLEMQGKWFVERNDVIRFPPPYFLNLDQDISMSPKSIADTSVDWSGGIERRGGVIGFCVGHLQGENCYKKVQ
jgi:hypothetical protein